MFRMPLARATIADIMSDRYAAYSEALSRKFRAVFYRRQAALEAQCRADIDAGRVSAAGQLPAMVWWDTEGNSYTGMMLRSQPRDGRGRFLPKSWLAEAELFLPADRAFFRSSIGAL